MQISVVMAVYNGKRFLREAIDSVLAQTLRDFEFIIVNDGSTDSSVPILEQYARTDPRIVIVDRPHSGLSASLNIGIEMARTDLIARFDADDRMIPNRLERQLLFLRSNPQFSVVCSHAYLIDVNGKKIGRSAHDVNSERGRKELDLSLFLEIVHPSVLMLKSAVVKVGGYRQTPFEDRDLWGRIITSGYLIGCQEECLLEYRLHGQSITIQERNRKADLIDFNILRRLKGEPELSYEDFVTNQKDRPVAQRLRRWINLGAMWAYKNATRHYAEGRLLKCAGSFLWSAMLRPWWTINRTRLRLSSPGHKT